MTVYVDGARNKLGRMKMCHMLADTPAELHAMAKEMGLKRKWFQDHPRHPHYDVTLQRRQQALKLGAKEIDGRDLIIFLHKNLEKA